MRKVYFDKTEIDGCTGVIIKNAEVIPAGATIYSMSIKDKNEEYQRYANNYDIHFIFDDDIPVLEFYTVPQVDIFARDSEGGFIATVGHQTDLENDAPICYINNHQQCFLIANTGKEFLQIVNSWKQHLGPYYDVVFYCSKSEAEKELEFFRFKNGNGMGLINKGDQ
jgi:hypothetical protein